MCHIQIAVITVSPSIFSKQSAILLFLILWFKIIVQIQNWTCLIRRFKTSVIAIKQRNRAWKTNTALSYSRLNSSPEELANAKRFVVKISYYNSIWRSNLYRMYLIKRIFNFWRFCCGAYLKPELLQFKWGEKFSPVRRIYFVNSKRNINNLGSKYQNSLFVLKMTKNMLLNTAINSRKSKTQHCVYSFSFISVS